MKRQPGVMKIAVSPEKGAILPVRRRRGFEQTQRGRADRDDAPARCPRRIEPRGGLGVDLAPFGVHPVRLCVLGFHRQKGAGADMQGDLRDLDAARRDGGS